MNLPMVTLYGDWNDLEAKGGLGFGFFLGFRSENIITEIIFRSNNLNWEADDLGDLKSESSYQIMTLSFGMLLDNRKEDVYLKEATTKKTRNKDFEKQEILEKTKLKDLENMETLHELEKKTEIINPSIKIKKEVEGINITLLLPKEYNIKKATVVFENGFKQSLIDPFGDNRWYAMVHSKNIGDSTRIKVYLLKEDDSIELMMNNI